MGKNRRVYRTVKMTCDCCGKEFVHTYHTPREYCRNCSSNKKIRMNKKVSQEGIRKGLLFDDLGDGGICAPVDYGHMVVLGTGALFDPIDLEARQEGMRWFLKANKLGLEKYKYITSALFAEQHDMIGPQQSNYQVWQRKIKKAFDPNVAADPANYIKP